MAGLLGQHNSIASNIIRHGKFLAMSCKDFEHKHDKSKQQDADARCEDNVKAQAVRIEFRFSAGSVHLKLNLCRVV